MTSKLISQGAEAKIFLDGNRILKSRTIKSYRHPKIDEELRRKRTKSEAKILTKAIEFGVNVPKISRIDKYEIELEFIQGDRLSETLNSYEEEKQFFIMKEIGKQTSLMHKNDIIHGDLTTSNTILREDKVFIIDFGLGFFSKKLEDKAVDLHLIKQALEAKHYKNHEKLYESFLEGYDLEDKDKVLKRLKVVEKRGRYRH